MNGMKIMTERKFTPPTSFPAEYVNGYGKRVTLVGKGVGDYPYVGQKEDGRWLYFAEDGRNSVHGPYDLHDLPKTTVHWTNDYGGYGFSKWYDSRESVDYYADGRNRTAVIRREWTEGELPKYFAEEV